MLGIIGIHEDTSFFFLHGKCNNTSRGAKNKFREFVNYQQLNELNGKKHLATQISYIKTTKIGHTKRKRFIFH